MERVDETGRKGQQKRKLDRRRLSSDRAMPHANAGLIEPLQAKTRFYTVTRDVREDSSDKMRLDGSLMEPPVITHLKSRQLPETVGGNGTVATSTTPACSALWKENPQLPGRSGYVQSTVAVVTVTVLM